MGANGPGPHLPAAAIPGPAAQPPAHPQPTAAPRPDSNSFSIAKAAYECTTFDSATRNLAQSAQQAKVSAHLHNLGARVEEVFTAGCRSREVRCRGLPRNAWKRLNGGELWKPGPRWGPWASPLAPTVAML